MKIMKKTFFLSLVMTFTLFSCHKNIDQAPVAHFFTDITDPEVGQEVLFTDDSRNVAEYEWDFGDGFISNDPNPAHVYTGTGTFDVVLTVYSKSGLTDQASITINVMIPTLLEIEVLEYFQEYFVPGASVWLYPTLADWEDGLREKAEAEGFTDNDGVVVFSHLGPYVYYVDVWETNHDNYTLKQENVSYIRTDEIVPHKINRFTAWVDVADHGKGTAFRDRSVIIKKIERKADDKTRPTPLSDTEGWQELYNRSIKLK
jgi:PKD repeat protein